MSRNMEIKAHLSELDTVRIRDCLTPDELATGKVLSQRDVYFDHVPDGGRLKLRYLDNIGQLISYSRPNVMANKLSKYDIYTTNNPSQLEQVLSLSYGILVIVSKKRQVYMIGQTRLHIDQVDDLPGFYIELEVVLTPNQSENDGSLIATSLMERFEITKKQLIDRSYSDLILDRITS